MRYRIFAFFCMSSALLSGMLAASSALADDTEIFFAELTGSRPLPNLLLILDNSTSTATGTQSSSTAAGGGTRFGMAKQAIDNLLNELHDVNIGLMTLNADQGGRILHPIAPIETARPQISALLAQIQPDASSGLSEALFEAYNYWAGLLPRYSGSSPAARLSPDGPFESPLSSATCAPNHIIYIVGSAPNEDTEANVAVPAIKDFIGTDILNPQTCSGDVITASNGACLDDIASLLHRSDLNQTTAIREGVTTHIFGLNLGLAVDDTAMQLLKNTAEAGGGTFSDATDASQLREALRTALAGFSAHESVPAISPVLVQSFNQVKRDSDLYFAVFEPTQNLHWPGNLKKFRFRTDGTIIDATSRPAIGTAGAFSASARSYWSQVTDGSSVTLGGAASRIPPPAERKVYTDATATPSAYPIELSNSSQELIVANTLITPSLLGLKVDHESARNELIEWARGGVRVAETMINGRFEMGDPLHAKPALVSYERGTGRTEAVIFVATNDGYLHAIDGGSSDPNSGGNELWSFIPQSMLRRMSNLRDNASTAEKGYGLDGTLVAYKLDRNDDGRIDTSAGDRVYLFFGMGRGGNEYYALDVSTIDSPRIMWRRSRNNLLTGLGQSWSAPVVTRVMVGDGTSQNREQLVVLVGGGYDVTQDNVTYKTDSSGNRLYMLDAVSGDLLWHAGPAGPARNPGDQHAPFEHARLTHSIPAALRVIDLTGDGYADRIYAADTGSQIWRFDIHNGKSAEGGLVTGGVLASLGNTHLGNHPIASTRRFFTTPDAALVPVHGQLVMNVMIGSGYRAHPLDTQIEERFYNIHDHQPFTPIEQATFDQRLAITESELEDVTAETVAALDPQAKGWMIRMSPGEKILSETLTFEGLILFTSFMPTSIATVASGCVVHGSLNRLYTINAADGSPSIRREGEARPGQPSDRYVNLQQGGIAGSPSMFFPKPDYATCLAAECYPSPLCLVGTEECGVDFTNRPIRNYWIQSNIEEN